MKDDVSRWLIRRGPASAPRDESLSEPSHMTCEWSGDCAAARTFASRTDAERFGRAMPAAALHVMAA